MPTTELTAPVVLGAGPVGKTVAQCLVAAGHEPRVLTKSGTALPGTKPVTVDLTNVEATTEAVRGADVLFHCAQPAYHRWPQDFPPLQRAILDAAEKVGAGVVAIENTYAYGRVSGPMTESTPFAPISVKGRVRAQLASELAEAHTAGRVRTVSVRASDFFGPHVLASAYGERFFEPLLAGKKTELLGNPDSRHSATYMPDIAEAMTAVAIRPDLWGRAWHAPTADAVTQRELVAIVAAAAGADPAFRVLSAWQLRFAGLFIKAAKEGIEMLYEFDHDYIVDSSAIETELGLRPAPLPEAAATTVEWFRSRR
jgi:nucleoside-diphosphate-sugar epimerase